MIYEDEYEVYVEGYSDSYDQSSTTELQGVTFEDLQAIRDDLVHTDLFGSFLVCGCIVSAVLFRRFV